MMKSEPSKKILLLTKYAMIWLVLVTALLIQHTALAQGPTPSDDEVNKIAKKLYCPVCENTPLDVCPTEACRQWREQIRAMLTEGKSEDEIIQYFILTYGVRASGDPPNKLASYLIPVTAILLGTLLLLRGFQTWKKPLATETVYPKNDAKPVQRDEYIAKMEEELKKRK